MSGEPIGTVTLEHCGDLVRVMVHGGAVSLQICDSQYRPLSGGVYLNESESTQIVELITKAAQLAPAVQAAADECRSVVLDAEAQYERAVADMTGAELGGAR